MNCVAITGLKGGAGKTMLAISLADFLSLGEKKVLLVDCDMETAWATRYMLKYRGFNAIDADTAVSALHLMNDSRPLKKEDFFCLQKNLYFAFSRIGTTIEATEDNTESEVVIGSWKDIFDVVIFDCQCAFTINDSEDRLWKTTNFALQTCASEKVLFVLEDDGTHSSLNSVYEHMRNKLNLVDSRIIFTKTSPDFHCPEKHDDVYLTHIPIDDICSEVYKTDKNPLFINNKLLSHSLTVISKWLIGIEINVSLAEEALKLTNPFTAKEFEEFRKTVAIEFDRLQKLSEDLKNQENTLNQDKINLNNAKENIKQELFEICETIIEIMDNLPTPNLKWFLASVSKSDEKKKLLESINRSKDKIDKI